MALVVLVYLGKWIIWIFSDMLNLEWIAFFKCFCWTNRRLFIYIYSENESLKLYTAASADVKNWIRFQDSFNSLYGRIGGFYNT